MFNPDISISLLNLVGKETMAKYQQFLWVNQSNKIIMRLFIIEEPRYQLEYFDL